MAVVTGLTADRMIAIEASSIVDGEIDEEGHLILTKHDGTEIDAGSALVAVPEVNLVHILDGDVFTQISPPEAYPEGVSLLHLTSAQASSGGWTNFTSKYGTVKTIKTGVNEIAQIWMRHVDDTLEPEIWIRGGFSSEWGSWRRLATSIDLVAIDDVVDILDTRVEALETSELAQDVVLDALAAADVAFDGRLDVVEAAWTSFTPVWRATSNPVIGNGTRTGYYIQIGKTIHFNMRFVMGSTTTYGSGAWIFDLPISPSTHAEGSVFNVIATKGVNRALAMGMYQISDAGFVLVNPTGNTIWQSTVPWSWASGDIMRISGTYEAS